jgi:hypothetical protein
MNYENGTDRQSNELYLFIIKSNEPASSKTQTWASRIHYGCGSFEKMFIFAKIKSWQK